MINIDLFIGMSGILNAIQCLLSLHRDVIDMLFDILFQYLWRRESGRGQFEMQALLSWT
jgi:hypothetical protein